MRTPEELAEAQNKYERRLIQKVLRRFATGRASKGIYVGDGKHIHNRCFRQANPGKIGWWWTTGNGEYLFILDGDRSRLNPNNPESARFLFRVKRENIQAA